MATILVVDDRPTNRHFLVTLLGYGGHHLLEAGDGAEALALAQHERPDLVITDILMPTMDGYEFTQRLRGDPELAATPVIFYTATYRAPEARRLADACGVREVLAKPSEPEEILAAVSRLLGSPPPPTAPPPAAGAPPPLDFLRQIEVGTNEFAAEVELFNEHLNRLLERGAGLVAERNRLRQNLANLATAFSAMQGDSLKLTALVELNMDLLAERDPARLGELLCGAAHRIIGSEGAGLILLAEDERTLEHFFWNGPGEATPPRLDQGVLHRLLQERRLLRQDQVSPEELGLRADQPAHNLLGLPIATTTQLYGLLYLVGEEFDEGDERIAQTLVTKATLIYENLHLYEYLQRHTAKLQVEISERRKAEEEVRQSAEHIHAIAQALPDLLFVLDEEGRYLEVLTSQESLLYAEVQKLKDRLMHEVLPQEAADLFLGVVHRTLSTGQPQIIEYPLEVPKGRRYFEGRTAPLPDPPGEKRKVVWVSRDITERKRAETQRRTLQEVREQVWQMKEPEDIQQIMVLVRAGLEKQELTFDACGVGLVEPAADPPVVRFHNLNAEGAWAVPANSRASAIVWQIWRSGKVVYRSDLEVEDPHGVRELLRPYCPNVRSVVDVPFSHGTLALNSAQPNAFSPQDIEFLQELAEVLSEGFRRLDDLKTLETTETQFRQAQKLEAVGQLAGGVAHDFNNLLTVVSGYSELLLRHLGADHPHHAHLQEIQQAADRGSGLVRQLLAFSRKQVLEPRVLDLNKVVRGLEKMLGRLIGEDVELVAKLAPDLGRVKADPGQLEQVLVNLAVNARDAMPQGGRLTIETRNVDLDQAYANHHAAIAPGAYVLLEMSDTGVGMDAATQARIFEPFFTTKEPGEGTGLGLATVYGIVKQSDGYIWVYSEPGQGTAFKIYLPRLTEEAQPVVQEAEVQMAHGSETVLLVEDEAPLRQLVAILLREQGYTVLEAGRGEEPLSLSAGRQGPIHAVVSDMVMPGMSGPDLVERLCASRPDLKVLYVSGYSADIIAQRVALKPGTAFLQKPFKASALLLKVREALDG